GRAYGCPRSRASLHPHGHLGPDRGLWEEQARSLTDYNWSLPIFTQTDGVAIRNEGLPIQRYFYDVSRINPLCHQSLAKQCPKQKAFFW
ncbi:MAG: hypothetical protein MJ249_14375, partial [Kiritimatiellae bacterium]|nr:hypothetical protein [Kiritimatiellia bacterium]